MEEDVEVEEDEDDDADDEREEPPIAEVTKDPTNAYVQF